MKERRRWSRGSHTDSFWGALPLSWSLIRWAHTHTACSSREFCMTCAAPRDKGRMGCCCPHGEAGGVGGKSVCVWGGCYKTVGGNRWSARLRLWRKGRSGDVLKASVSVCGGVSSSTTSPALGHWPLCRIHIKNSSPVKMTPETNPVTSSALKWPLVDKARTVCHFGLPVGRTAVCACGQYLYVSECKVGCRVCWLWNWGIACS